MQGDLRTTSLEQLCRTLDERAASGELVVTNGADEVRVWFMQGRVVRATSSGHELRLGDRLVHGGLITQDELAFALERQSSGRQLGEVLVTEGLVNQHVVRVFMQEQVLDALFAAVRWTVGSYEFTEEPLPRPPVPSDLTVPQLLFALESRHRAWDEITRTIPSLDAVPEIVPGADVRSTNLEPGEASIVQMIDGATSLERIASRLGFGPYEVATVVHGLSVLGVVRLVGGSSAAPAQAAPPAPESFADPATAPAPPRHQVGGGAPKLDAADAVAAAAALLRGDEPATPPPAAPAAPAPADDEDLALHFSIDDSPAPAAPAPAAAPPAPAPAAPPAPPVAPLGSAPSFRGEVEDDEDVSPWAFTIEGDDEDATPSPTPRRATGAPVTSTVTPSTATGTALPGRTPVPAPAQADPEPAPASPPPAPEPAPAPAAAEPSADPPSRPKTGEMSDLLRELRQLSGE